MRQNIMTFDIVINPAGASGWTGKVWDKLEPLFQNSSQECLIHFSSIEHGIEEIVRELTAKDKQINLVIVGGDGTMNAAVNGIRDLSRVHLGYIPAGSGNDLSRGLKLPKDRKSIAEMILKGEVRRKADVGEIVCHNQCDIIDPLTHEKNPAIVEKPYVRRFNVSSGIGFDAEIYEKADESAYAKKLFNQLFVGKMIYGFECLKLIMNYKTNNYEISYDRKPAVHVSNAHFSLCMIHPYEGGGFCFCPNADGSDGMFSTMTVAGFSPREVIALMPGVNSGRHLKNPKCSFSETKTAEIHSEDMV
ncbi:MAG: hypothetical protein EOM64_04835, partial [Erysipelotrichia bacterium]|nr:hypothetical protein [Erysipelotrichia bacterium]